MTSDSFRQELKRFDPRMDIELDRKRGLWNIVGSDKKNIKYIAKRVPFHALGKWIICDMYDNSPMSQGGHRDLNRKIDDEIERNEKIQEKDNKNKMDAVHDDTYDRLKYGLGERVSFANVEEKRSDFFVNDKRRSIESA